MKASELRPVHALAPVLATLAVLAAGTLSCGGLPVPVFLSPDSGEVPQAPDVMVTVSAEGAPSGSDLALFVGNVRVGAGPGESSITYLWDTTGLSGDVTLWAELTTPTGRRTEASRDVTVVDGTGSPPGLEFAFPLDGQAVDGETLIEIEATGERAAEVESVRIELDGELLVEDDQPDFWYAWDTTVVPDGEHTLRALGRYGSAYTSPAEVRVNVSNSGSADGPLTVVITSHADGDHVFGAVTLKAAIEHENDVFVVEFAIDGEVEHSTNSDPWQWVWNTLDWPSGSHLVTVSATDVIGNAAEASIELVVDEGGELAVQIDQPVEGEVISADYQVKCTLTYSDEITLFEFYLDGELARSTTTPPWQWAWGVTSALAAGSLAEGSHVIRAVAYDIAGGEASDEVTVTVDASP